MAAFQGSPAESHRVESRDQAPPPPLSTRLAGMSMQHAFLAQELEDFDNAAAATPTTQPSATPYAAAMHQMPPPGFGPGFYAPSPTAQAAKPNADAAAAAAVSVHTARTKAARKLERAEPFRLSHVMRAVLFVFGEKLVFAPHTETGRFIPHIRGPEAERIVTALFRKYADDDGCIHQKGWSIFMDELGLALTHVARDAATGKVADVLKAKNLSPDVVFDQCSKLPRGTTEPQSVAGRRNVLPMRVMDFQLFYRALLTVSKAALPEAFEGDPAGVFNEILTTSVTAVYAWGPNRSKAGSADELVRDARIALLFRAFMPNLWRVFLFYATDIEGNSAQGTYVFPAYAQATEQVLSSFRDINQSPLGPLGTFLRWEDEERTNPPPGQLEPNVDALTYVDCNDGAGFCIFLEALARLAVKGMTRGRHATMYPSAYDKVMALLSVFGVADPAKLEQVCHLYGNKGLAFATEDTSPPKSPFEPSLAAASAQNKEGVAVELMVTEAAWSRFVEDFSLIPGIMQKKAAMTLFRRTLAPNGNEADDLCVSGDLTTLERSMNGDDGAAASASSRAADNNLTMHSRSLMHTKEAEKKRAQLRLSGHSLEKMSVQCDVSSSDIMSLVAILNEQRSHFSSLVSTVEEEVHQGLSQPDNPGVNQEGIDELVVDALNEHVHEDFDRNEEQRGALHGAGIDVRHAHIVHTVLREPGDLPRKGDPEASDQVLMVRIPGRCIAARMYVRGLDSANINQDPPPLGNNSNSNSNSGSGSGSSSSSKKVSPTPADPLDLDLTVKALRFALAKACGRKSITPECIKVLGPIEDVKTNPETGRPVDVKTSLIAFHIYVPPGQSMFKIVATMRTSEYATTLMKHVRTSPEVQRFGDLRSVKTVENIRLDGQVQRIGPNRYDVQPDIRTLGLTQLALTTSWELPEDDFAEVFSSIAIYNKMCQLQGFVHRSSKGNGPIKYYQTHEHEDHENDALSVHEMFSLDLDELPDSAYYLIHIISSERGLQEVLSPSVELFDMGTKERGPLARINLYNTHFYEGHTPGTEGGPQSVVTCMLARITDKSTFRNGWKLEFFALRSQGTALQNTLGIKRCVAEALRTRTRVDGLKNNAGGADSLTSMTTAGRSSTANANKGTHLMRGSAKMFAAAASEWLANEVDYMDGSKTVEDFLVNVEEALSIKVIKVGNKKIGLKKDHVITHMNRAKANWSKGGDGGSVAGSAAGGGRRRGARDGGGGGGGSVADGSMSTTGSIANSLMSDALCKWFDRSLEKARLAATAAADKRREYSRGSAIM